MLQAIASNPSKTGQPAGYYNSASGPEACLVSANPVPQELAFLTQELENVERSFHNLCGRLEMILTPPCPEPTATQGIGGKPGPPPPCELANRINDLGMRAARIDSLVRHITDRVQI